MFEVVETFVTLSGEAPIPGEPVFLVRFSGCNLSCSYCDTPYNREVNQKISLEELEEAVLEKSRDYPGIKVLFTGGEPLLEKRSLALIPLMEKLDFILFYVETNGSVSLGASKEKLPRNCRYVVDWKTPSSGAAGSFLKTNLPLLRPGIDCIKMVVSEKDLEWAKQKILLIGREKAGLSVYLSPQWGTITLEKLASFILDNRLPAILSVQLHKLIWGSEARGV